MAPSVDVSHHHRHVPHAAKVVDRPAHVCDLPGPRIGKYAVSAELLALWQACGGAHSAMKSTPLAQLFKHRTLTVGQYMQYLVDRAYIFSHLEALLEQVHQDDKDASRAAAAQLEHGLPRDATHAGHQHLEEVEGVGSAPQLEHEHGLPRDATHMSAHHLEEDEGVGSAAAPQHEHGLPRGATHTAHHLPEEVEGVSSTPAAQLEHSLPRDTTHIPVASMLLPELRRKQAAEASMPSLTCTPQRCPDTDCWTSFDPNMLGHPTTSSSGITTVFVHPDCNHAEEETSCLPHGADELHPTPVDSCLHQARTPNTPLCTTGADGLHPTPVDHQARPANPSLDTTGADRLQRTPGTTGPHHRSDQHKWCARSHSAPSSKVLKRTCSVPKPSAVAQGLVNELLRAQHAGDGWGGEVLEWHAFVLYAELWFGGTVHAKAVELMIRDGGEGWRLAYGVEAEGEAQHALRRVKGVVEADDVELSTQLTQQEEAVAMHMMGSRWAAQDTTAHALQASTPPPLLPAGTQAANKYPTTPHTSLQSQPHHQQQPHFSLRTATHRATSLWRYGDDTAGRPRCRTTLAQYYFAMLGARVVRMDARGRERARLCLADAMEWNTRLFELDEYR